MVQVQPSSLTERVTEQVRLKGLVHCKCLHETDKLVLEQSCGTFFYCGDVFDVRPKEKIRDHAPISLQDLRRVTEKVELQYLKALRHREDGWLQIHEMVEHQQSNTFAEAEDAVACPFHHQRSWS